MAVTMRVRWKRAIQTVVGVGLAVGLLWLFFRGTDWTAAGRAVAGADVALLALSVACNVASLVLRAYRWKLLLRPLKADAPFGRVWRYFVVGFAVSSVLPGRLGEVIRPYLLARDQGLRFTTTFATVVTDRVIDLVSVLILLGAMYVWPEVLGAGGGVGSEASTSVEVIEGVGGAAALLAVAAAAVLVAVRLRTAFSLRAIAWLARPLPARIGARAVETASSFAEGAGGLAGTGPTTAILGLTLATWSLLVVGTLSGLAAFGFAISIPRACFLLAVLALGVALPTPGGAGTYHAGVIVVVGQLWGFAASQSGSVAAYAITSHVVAYAPVVLLGAAYLLRDGIRVFRLADEAAATRTSEAPPPASPEAP